MGLQSAMTTALTGLTAAETAIDVIGNNIANSNTVGFKESDVIFATQFLQTQSIGSAPSDTSGGTNPRQIGLGVKVAQITPNFSQGTIEISSNPLDLAIQGDGFLTVQGAQGQPLYTRNGQLNLNSLNQVVTSTGNKLLGYGVNDRYELQTATTRPIEIPLGSRRVAQETSNAIFAGVLNPTVAPGTTPSIAQSEVLGDASVERIDDAAFTFATDFAIRPAPSPGTATATGTTATPTLTAGVYKYRVVLVDPNGRETSASTEFNATAAANTDNVTLSSLPTETAPGWQRAIYRTIAGGNTFYRIGAPASAATPGPAVVDTLADATLVTNPQLVTTAIDNGSYLYHVTYYNPSNGEETRPSDPFGTLAVNDNTSSIRIDLSDVAPPTDPSFTQMRIYRNTQGTTDNFRLVDTVAAPGTGGFVASYIDRKPSSAIAAAAALDRDGPRVGTGSLLTDVVVRNGSTYRPLFAPGVLSFTAEQGGAELGSKTLTIAADTTVQDLLEFMNDALGLQQTSNVTDVPLPIGGGSITISDGVISVRSNYGEQNAIDIPLTAFRLTPTGSTVPQSLSVRFSETQAANGPGTTSEFVVYDSLGSPLTVRMTTVLESATSNSTTYRWYATSADSNPAPPELTTAIGNGLLVFDSRGDLFSSPSARISLSRELTASESPLEIDLDFSQVTSLSVNNAAGEPTSNLSMTSQDGFPPGVLTDYLITESGLILGQFSNGTQRTLGQVVMARFANNQGLRQVGDSLFSASVNSGEPFEGEPGQDGLGSLTAGARELSNTDVGQDLIEMILAQTQYQAGSRVISAAQELLDELLALQR
ncbi:MAG: flagellar hook-basal body complex protein [Lacipirellulaceae bacterium]